MKNDVRDIIYDVMFNHIKSEFVKYIEEGGFCNCGSSAGLFSWNLNIPPSHRIRSSGSRLFEDEKCWKIFNRCECNGYYNIIVYFNDNDEITDVEWIEDSKFDAIDKSIMYSIYEDLKKHEVSQVLIVETDNTGANISKVLEAELVTSSEEVEKPVNNQIEKEAVDTGIEDYYEIWKNSLKVVNIPKFDLNYFQRGLAYHVQKRGYGDGEFYGIMLEATEDLLRVMKLGTTSIHIESTEIIEIPLKEYMNGECSIVRLVEGV